MNIRPKGALFWSAMFAGVVCLTIAHGPMVGFCAFLALAGAILLFA